MSTSQPQSRESRKAARDRLAAEREAQKAAEARRERFVRIGVIVGVLALVALITGLVWKSNQVASNVALPAGANDKGGIRVGAASGPEMTFYEDFQCPSCAAFEKTTGATVTELEDSKKAFGLYYMLSFLDGNLGNDSSSRAANASGCASDAGKFREYHNTVYANQPQKEGTGYTNEQLKEFGTKSGITGDAKATFDQCVDSLKYADWVKLVAKTGRDAGITSTPTVLVGGKELARDQYTPDGLKSAVAAAS